MAIAADADTGSAPVTPTLAPAIPGLPVAGLPAAGLPAAGLRTAGLLTDLYELTMIDAAFGSGVARRRAVFELFCRRLPAGRRFGVVAGTGRFLDALERFRFDAADIDYLASLDRLGDETLAYLADWRFTGDVDGYGEGDLYVANSPVLTVESTFAEAVVLETLALSIFNFDSAVAAATARIRHASRDRFLLEAGSRRVDPEAAVAAARAGYIAGTDGTTNLAAGARYGIPVFGTASHAFTLAHADEVSAFRAQAARFGPASVFLVDTYDLAQGVRNAIEATGGRLAGIRIDSGDLAQGAREARAILDAAGATQAEIMLSGDLDEFRIAEVLASGAPVDGVEAGNKLVTGSDHPTAGFVYKLVAIADGDDGAAPLRPVQKRSVLKGSAGGRKVAWRTLDPGGTVLAEHLAVGGEGEVPAPAAGVRPLQVPLVRGGVRICTEGVQAARSRCAAAIAALPAGAQDLDPGQAAFTAGPAGR